MIAMLPQDRRAEVIQSSFSRVWQGWNVDGVSTSDALDLGSPFRVEFDVQSAIKARGTERKLSLPSLGFDLPEAPDEPAAGTPAVQFGVQDFTERVEIEVPEGQPAQPPLSLSFERSFGSFRSSYTIEGRTLRMERTLRLATPDLAAGDIASYEAFRSAISKDHDQAFVVTGVAPETPVVTALGLRKEGTAALDRKEYDKAVEVLRKATELDPKVDDGLLDLGRSLLKLNRYDEAIAIFTRLIEQSPFDQGAYAWRGHALGQLGKRIEAEKDLLKQIEVAPFYVWPYQELGRQWSKQGRHRESAEVYAKAAAIEPNVADNWLDLAQEQGWANRPDDARQSLQKATSLKLEDWRTIRAAGIYRSLGDAEVAGRLAEEALPSVANRLAKLDVSKLDDGDAYWSARLAEAWRYVGDAAAAVGDSQKAERYLDAAWRLEFLPEAGWALGELREKQGRLADAVDLWSMAAGTSGPWSTTLPLDRQKRIEAACAKLPDGGAAGDDRPKGASGEFVTAEPKRQSEARSRLTETRTVRLKGPVVADLTEQIVLVADVQGHVERVVSVSRKSPKDFARQLASLGPIRVPAWPQPGQHEYKAVRKGVFTCFSATGCALVFDLPEQGTTPVTAMNSIRITSIEPKEGAVLQRGERVTLVAQVHYEVRQPNVSAWLMALEESTDKGQKAPMKPLPLVESRRQILSEGEGDLVLSATFDAPTEPGRILIAIATTTPRVAREGTGVWLEVR
jgi:tetratricopeptide (TPR) repeat protein